MPPLKLSMKRTHLFSKGTAVPPDVTQTIGRRLEPVAIWSLSVKLKEVITTNNDQSVPSS